jgi:hypothetical protein
MNLPLNDDELALDLPLHDDEMPPNELNLPLNDELDLPLNDDGRRACCSRRISTTTRACLDLMGELYFGNQHIKSCSLERGLNQGWLEPV